MGEVRSLGSESPALVSSIGPQRPIPRPASVGVHLPTDRRSRSTHPLGDRSDRETSGQPPRDLLALLQGQPKLRALARRRAPSAGIADDLPKRPVLPPQILEPALYGQPS